MCKKVMIVKSVSDFSMIWCIKKCAGFSVPRNRYLTQKMWTIEGARRTDPKSGIIPFVPLVLPVGPIKATRTVVSAIL